MERETTNTLLPDRQRSFNRWLALLVALFLVTTIVFAILFGIEKGKSNTTTTPGPEPTATTTVNWNTTTVTTPTPTTHSPEGPVCLSPYCIKAADYLLNSIDETVNPCEDFYHFACGTWLKNARIPEDTGVQNIFNVLDTALTLDLIDLLSTSNETGEPNAVVNARNLYNSCINETAIENEGVEAVLSVVNHKFGGWPILLGSNWDASNFSLTTLLLALHQYDDGMLFSVATNTNQENSSIYDIELGQGTLGLSERDFYNESQPAIPAAYRQFMRDLALALANGTEINETEVEEMYAFERDIAQYHWTAAEQNVRDNETIRTTVGNLSESFQSGFNFTDYLRRIYQSVEVHLKDDDVVLVSEVTYLTNVSNITLNYPARVLQNYLVFRFLMNRASNMPKRIRSTREQFDRVFKGTTAEPTRATTCANFVNDNMGFAVSRLYVEKYFDDNARNQSRDIIANIRESMIMLIDNATWMDNASRVLAVEKENAIAENIGYPDFIVGENATKLEEMYQAYVFGGSLINNTLELQLIKTKENLAKLRDPVDRHAWGDLPPTVVNAFYDPSTNSISFPAGILQTPYFNSQAPKYLNYGGIGMVSGHEVTHGFDDEGRQYDKEGNRHPWWSNGTIEQFNERKQCIIDQYSNYTVAQIGEKLNGEQTQGENIADNGGIKSSFYAYQRWAERNPDQDHRLPGLNYTQEQLFFIGYAHGWCAKFTDEYARYRVRTDVHSIPQFRVLGPLSNFAEFDRVFSCTPGQGDSRVSKCAVW